MNLRSEIIGQATELIHGDGEVCPLPFIVLRDTQATFGMAINTDLLIAALSAAADDATVTGVAFGFDRFARPGQGTARDSVWTYAVGTVGQPPVFGFIAYDTETMETDEPNEAEVFWNVKNREEVLRRFPGWGLFR